MKEVREQTGFEPGSGESEYANFARLGYARLRGRVHHFDDTSGNEYRITDDIVQIVLTDGRNVYYSPGTQALKILDPKMGNHTLLGFREYAQGGADMTAITTALDRLGTVAVGFDTQTPEELGITVVNAPEQTVAVTRGAVGGVTAE